MDMAHDYQNQSALRKSRWMPWCICFAASLFFFYEFIQGNMFASIADDLMRDFRIQADTLAYLSSVYYVSNVLFLFGAGIILDRFSAKKTILIAMFSCVISTFVLSSAESFVVAFICRFVAGIGSAFCFLGPIRIASRWFPPKRMALITGLIVTIAMTGGMLAQYPLTRLVLCIGWRPAMVWLGWLGLCILGLMMVFIQDKHEPQASQNKINIRASAQSAYLNIQNLRAAIYASTMNMSVAVFGAVMGSLYLMQRLSIPKESASVINTMLFLGAIIGGPLMGWISDRWGYRIAPMKLGALASLLTMAAILYLPVTYTAMLILFLLLGLFTSTQIISYALVAESSPPEITAMAVSIVSILTQSGYIVFQIVFSKLLLHHGGMHVVKGVPTYSLADYQYATTLLPLGLVVAFSMLFGLRETNCHRLKG